MSNTIRRRRGLGRHDWRMSYAYHDRDDDIPVMLFRGHWYSGDDVIYYHDHEAVAAARKTELRYLHSEKYQPMNDPSWWVHLCNTKPERVEVRRLIHNTMKLVDLEDAPLFPEKRPHIYFW